MECTADMLYIIVLYCLICSHFSTALSIPPQVNIVPFHYLMPSAKVAPRMVYTNFCSLLLCLLCHYFYNILIYHSALHFPWADWVLHCYPTNTQPLPTIQGEVVQLCGCIHPLIILIGISFYRYYQYTAALQVIWV